MIDVYDNNGKLLYQIKKDIKGSKITSKEKEAVISMLRNDPGLKNQLKALGGWAEFKKMVTMNFPDYFPPIKSIDISDDKLYVRTYNREGDKNEYITLDLKGNFIKKTFIPCSLESGIYAQIAGARLYTIESGKLYFLTENEETEEWELHIEPLK
ncbi:MAG: hypothetical protein GY757_20260 [bacterium]|nr:hypothetical protein [bacterium]